MKVIEKIFNIDESKPIKNYYLINPQYRRIALIKTNNTKRALLEIKQEELNNKTGYKLKLIKKESLKEEQELLKDYKNITDEMKLNKDSVNCYLKLPKQNKVLYITNLKESKKIIDRELKNYLSFYEYKESNNYYFYMIQFDEKINKTISKIQNRAIFKNGWNNPKYIKSAKFFLGAFYGKQQ